MYKGVTENISINMNAERKWIYLIMMCLIVLMIVQVCLYMPYGIILKKYLVSIKLKTFLMSSMHQKERIVKLQHFNKGPYDEISKT